jgi:hypothetical protein
VRKLIVLPLFFATAFAQAFWGPISFIPTNPTAKDSIQFRIQTGACDSLVSNSDAEVSIVGTTIRVIKIGVSVTDPILCNFLPNTFTTTIGTVPAGTYRFELYRRENLRPTVVDLVQTANLTIGPAPASALVAASIFSWFGLSTLIFAFLLIGVCFSPRAKF